MITPVYAALLGVIFIALSIRTIKTRRKLQIGLGTAGNPEMSRAMRAHANFAEYTPLTLLLIFMAETNGLWSLAVHALCAILLLGRALHAYGVSQTKENFRFRVSAMVLTFTSLSGAIIGTLYIATLGGF